MRITGGIHRSRTLIAPRGQATRPTSDRVREALFSMLTAHGVFSNAEQSEIRVLDLYAGSGALGFEALSRGASFVVFVESARAAIQAIHDNAQALNVSDQVTVLAMRIDKALATFDLGDPTSSSFDLVLLDPPYEDVREDAFAEVLEKAARLLAASGILVVEHSSDDAPMVPGLTLDRRRRHSDTTLSLFLHTPIASNASEDEDTHA